MPARAPGLSPRVRGSPDVPSPAVLACGSIPACAGEPSGLRARDRYRRVYPACAGEPRPVRGAGADPQVYPRVCGGASFRNSLCVAPRGLSPRVRGSRPRPASRPSCPWSIPACAGEPPGRSRFARVNHGLSPRVRGSLDRRAGFDFGPRSIPACAGEPLGVGHFGFLRGVYPRVCGGATTRASGNRSAGVYPRVCGGAPTDTSTPSRVSGLSPRVRGSLVVGGGLAKHTGSIPACAGEPMPSAAPRFPSRVYPRVCGGAGRTLVEEGPIWGLSPRVRGSLGVGLDVEHGVGSIPACAGEPSRSTSPVSSSGVYPRVCGGAVDLPDNLDSYKGLSPRVRGSHRRQDDPSLRPGSIPACAGEPGPSPRG